MSFNAGAIEADLTLGRSAWTRDLKKTQKEIRDLENTSIGIDVDLFDDNAKVAMDNLELMLDDLGRSSYTPEVDLETRDANVRLERLDDRLDALDSRIVTVQVFADTDNADIAIDNLENDLFLLDNDPVRVNINVLIDDAELNAFIAKLDKLDLRTVTVAADADTTNAMIQLDLLENQMDLLDNDPINIKADADIGDAMMELGALYDAVQAVDSQSIDIDVDIDDVTSAIGEVTALSAVVAAADAQSIDIDVDVDRGALESLVGSGAGSAGGGGGGSLGLLRILMYAILLLSPILAVAISATTAAIIGFAAAVAGAGGAAVVLGAGLIGLHQRFKDTDPSDYTPAMQAYADSIEAVGDAWETFLDGIDVAGFNLMSEALDIVAIVLPTLVPLFNAVAEAMSGVLGGIRTFVESSEYDEMIDFFSGFGVDMLVTFLNIGGNLLRFFGRLFEAIAPFATEMMKGLEDTTAGWAEWADDLENNDSFQTFVDNALEYGPMLLDMLGSMLDAFMALGDAIEPLAGPMLNALTGFFDLIADAPIGVLTGFVGAVAGLFLGAKVLPPVLGPVATLLSAIATASGLGLAPVLLIAGAIVGIGLAVYDAWKNNEQFRESVMNTWTKIEETVRPIIEDIEAAVRENWEPMEAKVEEIWGSIESIVVDTMLIIESIVGPALDGIAIFWEEFGDDIIDTVVRWGSNIGQMIGGYFTMIEGLFQVFAGLFTGDWDKMWGGIEKIASGALDFIAGAIGAAAAPFTEQLTKVKNNLVQTWTATVTDMKTEWTQFRTWITEKFNNFAAWFAGLAINASKMWDDMGAKWGDMRTSIGNKWADLKGWFSGLAVNANALWDDIGAKWGTMKTDIEGKWANFKSWVGGLAVDAASMFTNIPSAFKGAINQVIGWWNGLSFSFPGIDPPGPGPKFAGFTVSPPNISYLAEGGYITEPTFSMVGEGGEPEIVSPESKMREIVETHSGDKIDYAAMASAIAEALRGVLSGMKGVSAEDLERLIEAASVNISIGDNGGNSKSWMRELMFELRRMGYGGLAA